MLLSNVALCHRALSLQHQRLAPAAWEARSICSSSLSCDMLMMILTVQTMLSTATARVKELEAQLVEAQRLLSARGSELQSLTDIAQASATELLRVRGSIMEASSAGCILSPNCWQSSLAAAWCRYSRP